MHGKLGAEMEKCEYKNVKIHRENSEKVSVIIFENYSCNKTHFLIAL